MKYRCGIVMGSTCTMLREHYVSIRKRVRTFSSTRTRFHPRGAHSDGRCDFCDADWCCRMLRGPAKKEKVHEHSLDRSDGTFRPVKNSLFRQCLSSRCKPFTTEASAGRFLLDLVMNLDQYHHFPYIIWTFYYITTYKNLHFCAISTTRTFVILYLANGGV